MLRKADAKSRQLKKILFPHVVQCCFLPESLSLVPQELHQKTHPLGKLITQSLLLTCAGPAATLMSPLFSRPGTRMGSGRAVLVVVSPSCPWSLRPQL